MTGLKLTNNASTQLASAIDDNDTSLSVDGGTGSLFPSLGVGEWFPLVLVDSSGNREIMRATARSGDVITVTRAQESTSARSFDPGSRVDLRLTAAAIADIIADLEDGIDDLNTDLSDRLSAAANARLLMPQATAETGWTQVTSVNDRVLRVVSTAGGGTGGSWTISGLTGSGSGTGVTGLPNATTGVSSGGGAAASDGHQHSVVVSVTVTCASDASWRPSYLDVIVAEKD